MALLGRVAPPLAVMGLIFFLSAQPDLGTDLGWIDTVLRKCAHMGLYGLLWLLWARAVGPWPALAITLAYAVSDEYHQTFVTGRHGAATDVLIDAVGVALAAVLARQWTRSRASRAR
jgi:VanZ family protein